MCISLLSIIVQTCNVYNSHIKSSMFFSISTYFFKIKYILLITRVVLCIAGFSAFSTFVMEYVTMWCCYTGILPCRLCKQVAYLL